MHKYNWNYPTTMWVGENRINDIALACKNLDINKPLLVTDNGLAQSDIVKNTLSILKENGITAALYSNVVGNPTGTNVTEGADYYNKNNCDGVIAFGGGSGLDVGKAIAFMSGQTLPIWDFEDVGDNWTKANSDKIAPIIAVPTTAGTGSETGRASVILNERNGCEKYYFSSKIFTFNSYFRSSFNSWVAIKNDSCNWDGCISTQFRSLLCAKLSPNGRWNCLRRNEIN